MSGHKGHLFAVPVVVLTGYADRKKRERGIAAQLYSIFS